VQIFFPPLGRLAKEGKREREKRIGKARVHLAEFKFKFEFLQTRFENLSKKSLEVSNMVKRSWPKFEDF
jgi:hypothetical protein